MKTPTPDHELFDPPRWPGGPLICIYENLPAFDTLKDLNHFHERNAHQAVVDGKWLCHRCGKYHMKVVGFSNLSGSGSASDKMLPTMEMMWVGDGPSRFIAKPIQNQAEKDGHKVEYVG